MCKYNPKITEIFLFPKALSLEQVSQVINGKQVFITTQRGAIKKYYYKDKQIKSRYVKEVIVSLTTVKQ